MITAHLLTKNNADTIEQTLKSIKSAVSQIVVVDQNSTDGTTKICETYGAFIVNRISLNRSELRNYGISKSKNDWNLMVEPWEILVKFPQLEALSAPCYYTSIIQAGTLLLKEVRLWRSGCSFVNPAFERIKENTEEEADLILYSPGRKDYSDLLEPLRLWRGQQPLMPQPFYYESCVQLAIGDWDKFIFASDHYLNLMQYKFDMSSVMNRYNYAFVQLVHKKNAKVAIQNLVLCLCAKPLMAEFWCLLGDVYYHLLGRFEDARCFYENAIVLGSRRLGKDKWPMDITKYKKYPNEMIDSCNKILDSASTFRTIGLQGGASVGVDLQPT